MRLARLAFVRTATAEIGSTLITWHWISDSRGWRKSCRSICATDCRILAGSANDAASNSHYTVSHNFMRMWMEAIVA
jgi:hypothetical protein